MALRKSRYRSARTPIHWRWSCTSEMSITPAPRPKCSSAFSISGRSDPTPSHRAINSNHEMYSGGFSYFQKILPKFGQEASYFAFQNKNWTLIGLDVAYKDHDIDDQQVAWLKEILSKAGDRKVVLFSHHQLYSHLGIARLEALELTGLRTDPAQQAHLRLVLGPRASLHRCSRAPTPTSGSLARCIGHGGMPESRKDTRNLPRAGGASLRTRGMAAQRQRATHGGKQTAERGRARRAERIHHRRGRTFPAAWLRGSDARRRPPEGADFGLRPAR